MAKPRKTKSGIFILTVCFENKRKVLTLGKIPPADAKYFADQINYLTSHRKHNQKSIPEHITLWLDSLARKHRKQLTELGLLSRFDASLTVEELIDEFLDDYDSRPDIEANTKQQFRSAMENRIPSKLKKKLLSEVEPTKLSDRRNAKPVFSKEQKALFRSVESWQRNYYAKSTWSRANGRLREIGQWAVNEGFCDHNPFILLPKPGEDNPERNVHVPAEWVEDAIEMCLDPDTRLLFVLGRFAGLRLPSEARTLKPEHINFEKSQLHVFDSKKKRFRITPLFDVVRDELIRHSDSEQWNRYVLSSRFRTNTDANNYGLMKDAVAKTQWDLWPKLRQNLRASCENDLLERFPERLVTVWLGHTIKVSRKHYQKQKDSDYLQAVERHRTEV